MIDFSAVKIGDVLKITGDGVYGWGDQDDLVHVVRIDSEVVVVENVVRTRCMFRREFSQDEFELTDFDWKSILAAKRT